MIINLQVWKNPFTEEVSLSFNDEEGDAVYIKLKQDSSIDVVGDLAKGDTRSLYWALSSLLTRENEKLKVK